MAAARRHKQLAQSKEGSKEENLSNEKLRSGFAAEAAKEEEEEACGVDKKETQREERTSDGVSEQRGRIEEAEEKSSQWRVIFSEKLQRPFFFHTATNIGQFTVPADFDGQSLFKVDSPKEESKKGIEASSDMMRTPGVIDYSMGTNNNESFVVDEDDISVVSTQRLSSSRKRGRLSSTPSFSAASTSSCHTALTIDLVENGAHIFCTSIFHLHFYRLNTSSRH